MGGFYEEKTMSRKLENKGTSTLRTIRTIDDGGGGGVAISHEFNAANLANKFIAGTLLRGRGPFEDFVDHRVLLRGCSFGASFGAAGTFALHRVLLLGVGTFVLHPKGRCLILVLWGMLRSIEASAHLPNDRVEARHRRIPAGRKHLDAFPQIQRRGGGNASIESRPKSGDGGEVLGEILERGPIRNHFVNDGGDSGTGIDATLELFESPFEIDEMSIDIKNAVV